MPVHIAITRRARPGWEAEFQQALREFFQTSLTHDGVPVAPVHEHNASCHHHGCDHAALQLLAGVGVARNRYAEFFGSGFDCFAF